MVGVSFSDGGKVVGVPFSEGGKGDGVPFSFTVVLRTLVVVYPSYFMLNV